MQTKLTLRLDQALIVRAKRWASGRGISLSEAVAGFFTQLSGSGSRPQLTEWTRRLVGAAAGRSKSSSDKAVREQHRIHLERKHR